MMSETSKRIALVSGGNKGLGLETCRRLGEAGLTVLLGARNPDAGEKAASGLRDKGHDARFVALDLDDPATFEAAARTIEGEFGRLDVLVNNAGIFPQGDGPPIDADLDAVRRVLDVNFFRTVELTRAMLPLLRKASAARIVNVSSGLGSLTQNADPNWAFAGTKILGYNSSKAALNMFTVQLAAALKADGILVNASDPGYTATDLNGNSGHQTVEEGTDATVRLALLPEGDTTTGAYFNRDGVVPW